MSKGSTAKRSAPSTSTATKSKKAKTTVPVAIVESEESGSSSFEDLEQQLGDEDEDDESEGSFEDLEDDEENEFELEGAFDEGAEQDDSEGDEDEDEEDDDMIGDDEEDLHAGLDNMDEDGSDGSDSEEEGDEETAATPAIVPLKKANQRNSRAPKPLTPAELRALAFAELTASPISNIIATQVSSVLDPITPPPPATSPLQPLLQSLHAHITSLPSSKKTTTLAGLGKKGTVIPSLEEVEGKWSKMEFGFEKPRAEDVRIVGRWAWDGGIKVDGEYILEMAIGMPASLLQPKDYLSPRFLAKSTHYLVSLSSQLPSSLGPTSLSYVRLPSSQGYALEIRSTHTKGTEKVGLSKTKGAVLRLRIVWPAETFSHSKLSPSSNIVRPIDSPPDSKFPPTPVHATSLLFSSLPLQTHHLKYHHTLTTQHSSYTSSIRLLQRWASLRSYPSTLGPSSDFWAWCVARTLNWGTMAGGVDPAGAAAGGEAWASWRKTIEWLAGVKWEEGVWFRVEGDKAFEKDEFKEAFKGQAIFVDPTGTVNLAAGIELSTLEMLKQDAQTTIALLLSGASDEQKFESAFLREIREAERFDNFARITVPSSTLTSIDPDARLDSPDTLSHVISSISSTLRRALGTRIKAFQLTCPATPSVPLTGSSSPPTSFNLTLGLLLDPTESLRLVDQGPSAEDEAACAEFSAFWGPKSELRRFKDGSIVESLVWDETSPGNLGPQRNKVVSHIVKYILNHRHGIEGENIDFFAGAMDHLIVEFEGVRRAIFLEDSVATGKGFSAVIGAFDAIQKEIKDLSDLPLTVASVAPSSVGLRYGTIFTPSPRRLKDFDRFPESTKYLETHDILLTLEGSGRWPDDLEGVQKIKAAFLTKIGEGLEATRSVLRAQVVFDLEARPTDDNVSLEILTASGYAFRARIYYERSLLLLKERAAQLGPEAAAPSIAFYNERFVHSPRHHGALATLQHHFVAYSPTIRLVHRWFSSHMLIPHISFPQLELIVASIFLDSTSPYEPPQSGATGFTRVMERLSSWKWRDEPLCLPLYTFATSTTSGRRASYPPALKTKSREAFEKVRLEDPNVEGNAWVVCTEEDVGGIVWGGETSKVVAARVRALAKATLKSLQEGLVGGGLVVDSLFSPPLGDYSFLIHLDSSANPRAYQALTVDAQALSGRSSSSVLSGSLMGQVDDDDDDDLRLDFDPVTDFVAELERQFPSTFLLFYSPEGSPVIGGIWNPSVEAPRPFKVGLGFPIKVLDEKEGKAKVVLDKLSLLKQVEKLGKGLVKKVELIR